MKAPIIKNTNFKSQLKTISKDTLNQKASLVIPAVNAFVSEQANTHGNYSPLSYLHGQLGSIYKPKEFKTLNTKNHRDYCESIGLEFDTKSKTFHKAKGVTSIAYDAEWYKQYEAPKESTPSEKFAKAVESADKNGITLDDMMEIIAAHFDVEVATSDEVSDEIASLQEAVAACKAA